MAFITRAGRPSGSVQSLFRRNSQPLFSPHQSQQQRSFTKRQLYDISKNKLQIYKSTSTNPYVNLSIEHHLLQNSPPHATVLFLYKNRPCVVIGRNQNPWLELSLALCQKGITSPNSTQTQKIDIVRRRSGGGTVFHDEGNVNWTVISPKTGWKKDKHAEMVVRALKMLDIKGKPRVNERHDIVLDVDDKSTYKISGSAYKIIRNRALHHGTCLLESPYLNSISEVLKSPAEPYIKANGVDSVRSPVCNVGIGTEEFIDAVVDEFKFLYDWDAEYAGYKLDENDMLVHEDIALKVKDIKNGVEELMSDTWIYGQTPNFVFSTAPVIKEQGTAEVHPAPEDPRPRPPLPSHLPPKLRIFFQFRYGKCITAGFFNAYHNMGFNSQTGTDTTSQIFKHRLYHIRTWEDIIVPAGVLDEGCGTPESRARDRHNIAMWLNHLLPPVVGTAVPSPPDVYE
ncbi:hypothetical protein V8F33_001901 [Rhypophila sp. PSN 637]